MNIQEIIEKYNSGSSMAQLSREFALSAYMIKKILSDNNIKLRTRAEQNKITNMARGKSVNHNYFNDIATPEQAWFLGFAMADGYVEKDRNRISFQLSSKDEEILVKIKKLLEIENAITKKETLQGGFDISILSWSSEQHKTQLAKYGIDNRKTYKPAKLPIFKNSDLTKSFILGYFDGDGSFTVTNQKYCRFRICAHRQELLQDIANFCEKEYNAKYSLSQDARGLYELSISTTFAISILTDLYKINQNIFLQRKKNKFIEYLEYNKTKSL